MSDEPSLALQKAIRARLTTSPEVGALVPAANIVDRHGRPTAFPAIILGEAQTVRESVTYDRRHVRAYLTLHLWAKENGLAEVKRISGAVRRALRDRLAIEGAAVVDSTVEEERFLRDPGGEHSHGILTIAALVEEPTS